MATPVILPRQGQSVETCIITEILVKKGDNVKEGDILFRYETDKAAFEIESPESGTVLDIMVGEGDEVAVLENLMVIGKPGEDLGFLKMQDAGRKTEDSESGSLPVPDAEVGTTRNPQPATRTEHPDEDLPEGSQKGGGAWSGCEGCSWQRSGRKDH